MVKWIIDSKKFNIFSKNTTGFTYASEIIQTACKFGKLSIMKWIIDTKGYKINEKGSNE